MVYILQNSENLYKIGFTKDVNKRIKQLSTGSPYDIKLIKAFETNFDSKIESYLKMYFSAKRIKGEWFNLSSEDIDITDTIVKIQNENFIVLSQHNPFFT